jgi:hypothetical protein
MIYFVGYVDIDIMKDIYNIIKSYNGGRLLSRCKDIVELFTPTNLTSVKTT